MTGNLWLSVFMLIATSWQTISSAHINGSCTDSFQCLSDIKFSYCLESKCVCKHTGEFLDHNVTRCKAPPKANCSSDSSSKCVDHALCVHDVCTCDNGYAVDYFDRDIHLFFRLYICAKNKSVGIGGRCEGSKQCGRNDKYSYCDTDHKCKCGPSTPPKEISGKQVCTIKVFPNQRCSEKEICDIEHASCKNHNCTCDKGYEPFYPSSCSLKPSPEDDSLPITSIILFCFAGLVVVSIVVIFIVVKFKKKRSLRYKSVK